jgi:hypothetical protein
MRNKKTGKTWIETPFLLPINCKKKIALNFLRYRKPTPFVIEIRIFKAVPKMPDKTQEVYTFRPPLPPGQSRLMRINYPATIVVTNSTSEH